VVVAGILFVVVGLSLAQAQGAFRHYQHGSDPFPGRKLKWAYKLLRALAVRHTTYILKVRLGRCRGAAVLGVGGDWITFRSRDEGGLPVDRLEIREHHLGAVVPGNTEIAG